MSAKRLGLVKALIFLACLLPLFRLIALGVTQNLGANPIEFITRSTGLWTLVMLCLSLAVTPIRRLSGWSWLLRLRRMLGLFCFFYVVLHLSTWVWFDHWFDVSDMWKDIVKRPFITVGFVAMLLLWPLALSSNHFAMRKLGRNWARLHRLVYLIAALAMLHFWWMRAGKNNFLEPIIYGAILALLLGYRIYIALKSRVQAGGYRSPGKTDSEANKSSSFSR
jgi:methionine sulfoxide reductase heme-binding subunit